MKLCAELFESLVGDTIEVELDTGARVALTLDEVIRNGPAQADAEGGAPCHTAFTLDLSGPREPVIEALTYTAHAPGLAPMPLFFSAHGQDETRTFYAVTVN